MQNSEKTFHRKDIYGCDYKEGKFSFLHTEPKRRLDQFLNVDGKEY